jgi:selenocysteine lyase/cysteine desulfurase
LTGIEISRRGAITAALGAAVPVPARAAEPAALPLRDAFGRLGTFLNAAATHPIPHVAAAAAAAEMRGRVDRAAPQPARPELRAAIARLINAAGPEDIGFVPSTGLAENAVATALNLGPDRGVVTDALHFDGALAMYGERARHGMPLTVVRPRDGRILIDDVAAAIRLDTRLIALSQISNINGFHHDIGAICAMAHARGVLVFADVIQAVGAVPIDVRATGVDFCAASTYKWLMGDLGFAFLYVRPDVVARVPRPVVGWRQLSDVAIAGQGTRFDPPVAQDRWSFAPGVAGWVEAGQPSNVTAAAAAASIALIERTGIGRIAAHRDALRGYARETLGALPGVLPITPPGMSTSIESFAVADAARRFAAPFAKAGITVGLYDNRIRLSPSLYNDRDDIDRLVAAMRHG